MSSKLTRTLLASLTALPLLAAPALAGQAGRHETPLTPIALSLWSIPAGRVIEAEVYNATLDPVLHVQNRDDPNGGFVAGNDDCTSNDFTRSCVTIPAGPNQRNLAFVVRSFGGSGLSGTARLRIKSAGSVIEDRAITFAGEQRAYSTTIPAGALFAGTGIQKLTGTFVLLVINGQAASGGAFAWGTMPRVRAPAGGANTVILGHVSSGPAGPGMFVWDEDNAIRDDDGDGLSNTLEFNLNLASDNPDIDGDGISDGEEILGRKAATDVHFPMYGADPKVPDVFVEADWVDCPGAAAPCSGNRDQWRLSGAEADSAVSIYRGPTSGPVKIALHMDTGLANPAPARDASLLRWGDWGGATNRAATGDCNTRTPGRDQWHLGVISGGGGNAKLGTCFFAASDGRVPAHELGHNLGLDHGGVEASGAANTKVIYPSIMSYLYQNNGLVGFSTGTFMGVNFNPNSVNETNWRGSNTTASMAVIASLNTYLINGNAVDWNLDGKIQDASTPVKAKINPSEESGRMRDNGWPDKALGTDETDPTLGWLAGTSGVTPRLIMTSRRTTDNAVLVRHTTNVESACKALTTGPTASACATWSAVGVAPSSVASKAASSMSEYVDAGTRRMMVTYPAVSDGRLRAQIVTLSSSGSTATWSAPTTIGTATVDSAVSSLYDPVANRVDVYGVSGGVLKRWSFNIASKTWDLTAVTQQWADGTNVAPTAGVGLAPGHHRNDSTRRYFMMVPYAAAQNVDIALRSTTANRWDRLPGILLKTDTRPGCAYYPFSNSAVTDGRFMCIVKDTTWGGIKPALVMSEGNDPSGSATFRRLNVWRWALYYGQYDKASGSAMTLTYDPARDSNVRGAWSPGGAIWFQPLADGALNRQFTDQDDFDFLRKNLACSITNSGCKRCTAMNSNGTCSNWVDGFPR